MPQLLELLYKLHVFSWDPENNRLLETTDILQMCFLQNDFTICLSTLSTNKDQARVFITDYKFQL